MSLFHLKTLISQNYLSARICLVKFRKISYICYKYWRQEIKSKWNKKVCVGLESFGCTGLKGPLLKSIFVSNLQEKEENLRHLSFMHANPFKKKLYFVCFPFFLQTIKQQSWQ